MPNSFGRVTLELLPSHVVRQLAAIYEFKGKEELYRKQAPELLTVLQRSAIVESTESSNRIEGIVASPERVREIVGNGSLPTNRSEAEIAGYRDVLATIHASHPHIDIAPNYILQFHRDLFAYTGRPGGEWKRVDNLIEANGPQGREIVFVPVPAYRTADEMHDLCFDFNQAFEKGDPDHLLSLSAFVLDFLCVHPFADGNGRMARLLTSLLLYKAGFSVARYVSVERLVENTKGSYYSSLRASSERWHDGEHSLLPWWEYFLGIILAAYRELDQKLGGFDGMSKSDRVKLAIEILPVLFSKADVVRACPGVSERTVKRTLEELRSEGRVALARAGRAAMWKKTS